MKENHQREEEDKVEKKKGKKDYIEMARERENEMMKYRKRK